MSSTASMSGSSYSGYDAYGQPVGRNKGKSGGGTGSGGARGSGIDIRDDLSVSLASQDETASYTSYGMR
jgi:hypothetical protein